MPPVVCRFWQQGNCRYGERCKFDHPADRGPPNGNRFAALQTTNDSNSRMANGSPSGGSSSQNPPFSLDKAAIITDLSSERPQWILSAYGPGRMAPVQLFGGPVREQSFEEMRLMHYAGLASGNPQQAVQEADSLFQASEQQIRTVLSDVDGAIEFIAKGVNDHPNRLDIVRDGQASSTTVSLSNPFNGGNVREDSSNPFAVGSQPTSKSFGAPSQPASNPSQLGSAANAVGLESHQVTPAFGAPSAPIGTFGQPSALGAKPNPFGAPATSASSFGKPSGSTPVFGMPSASAPAFGAPSQLGSGGAFGQPSVLGQKPNPFGIASGQASGNLAASSSAPSNVGNVFGQPQAKANPFGVPSQPTSNAFGAASQPIQPNPLGQTACNSTNPFISSSTQPNPFGSHASPIPFGAPSPAPKPSFSTTSQPRNTAPFGIIAGPQSNPLGGTAANPNATTFARPSPSPVTNTSHVGNNPLSNAANVNPFAAAGSTAALYNNHNQQPSSSEHPAVNSYSSRDGNGRLTVFKGQRVVYQENVPGFQSITNGKWQKIWFPDGEPPVYKDTELPDSEYDDATKESYNYWRQAGKFKGGVMPLKPPKREWCLWDF